MGLFGTKMTFDVTCWDFCGKNTFVFIILPEHTLNSSVCTSKQIGLRKIVLDQAHILLNGCQFENRESLIVNKVTVFECFQ